MQRLHSVYLLETVPLLKEKFLYRNNHEVPKMVKIVVSRGLDESCQSTKILETLVNEINLITGQFPITTRSKKSIATFKLKENMPVGIFLTLRGKKMYAFLDRLINLVLPRIRDFQGLSRNSFDNFGNYTLGLREQLMFPEIEFDNVIKSKGLSISLITNCKNKEESIFLLMQLGFPLNS
uniref:Large ribosomal subunit protein uL5c n=1 Tax=Euglenaformis proxima TaxID=299110 RepID=A0A023HHW5_9EUGL|nr:ribosomal protein L5 [Euglenaformis proxima]AGL12010.1 ribosomal protein L5 [Euglenaformis proxima]